MKGNAWKPAFVVVDAVIVAAVCVLVARCLGSLPHVCVCVNPAGPIQQKERERAIGRIEPGTGSEGGLEKGYTTYDNNHLQEMQRKEGENVDKIAILSSLSVKAHSNDAASTTCTQTLTQKGRYV